MHLIFSTREIGRLKIILEFIRKGHLQKNGIRASRFMYSVLVGMLHRFTVTALVVGNNVKNLLNKKLNGENEDAEFQKVVEQGETRTEKTQG